MISEMASTPKPSEFTRACVPRNGYTPELPVPGNEVNTLGQEVIEIEDDNAAQQELRQSYQHWNAQHELKKKILSRVEKGNLRNMPYRPQTEKLKENIIDLLQKYQAARGGGLPFAKPSHEAQN